MDKQNKKTKNKLMLVFSSKLFYLFLGLFLAVTVSTVYAELSTVTTGQTLTATMWNNLVNEVNRTKIANVGYFVVGYTGALAPNETPISDGALLHYDFCALGGITTWRVTGVSDDPDWKNNGIHCKVDKETNGWRVSYAAEDPKMWCKIVCF